MPQFSKTSQERLSTCHPDLQKVCNEAIKDMDFAVICGQRSEVEQNKAFAEGHSKLRFPESKHNKSPSEAVDLVPVKYVDGKIAIDWNDIAAFRRLAMHILNVANNLGIPLQWGGNWIKFRDFPHYELITKES